MKNTGMCIELPELLKILKKSEYKTKLKKTLKFQERFVRLGRVVLNT